MCVLSVDFFQKVHSHLYILDPIWTIFAERHRTCIMPCMSCKCCEVCEMPQNIDCLLVQVSKNITQYSAKNAYHTSLQNFIQHESVHTPVLAL